MEKNINTDSYKSKSCGAVLFRRNGSSCEYLLLLQKKSKSWSFPKGHVEADETEEETALREIYEETGYKVALLPSFRETVHYLVADNTKKQVVLFIAEADEEPQIQKEEIDEYRWVTAAEAKELMYENYGRIIDSAEKYISAES